MPTYDYICENCDHAFEQSQSITAGSLRKCPKCKKMKLRRLIGAGSGVIFKGSGFYETDYRSKSYNDEKEKDKKAAEPKKEEKKSKDKPKEKKAEKKAESKPKGKSEDSKK